MANPDSKYRRAYMPTNEKGSATLRLFIDTVRPLEQQQRLALSHSDDTPNFDDQTLTWPAPFQQYKETRILTKTDDLLTKFMDAKHATPCQ